MNTNAIDRFFSGNIEFIFGASKIGQLPLEGIPEIAFIGKSSLINSLTNRKQLARVSHTPGRTQQINFFKVQNKFILVDLPGYGYAKVSADQHQTWEKIITHYLRKRESLKLIYLLIDSRRGIKANDLQVLDLLRTFQKDVWIIYTKLDKIGQLEQKKLIEEFDVISSQNEFIKNKIFTSSRSTTGVTTFKACFWQYVQSFIT